MALTKEQIVNLRKKYNVGSFSRDFEAEKTTRASDRINELKNYKPEPVSFNNDIDLSINEEKEKSTLSKLASLTDKTFGKAGQLLFGSTGKAVGGLITGSIGAGASLLGKKEFGKELQEQAEKDITPTNIAFSTLEMLPTGSFTKILSKIPGGKQLIKAGGSIFGKLSGKLKEKAVKLYTEALAPTTKALKRKTAKVVPSLLEEGVTGSLKKIQEKAASGLIRSGEQIDEAVKAISKNKVSTKSILNKLNESKSRFIVDGVVVEPNAIKAIEGIEGVVTKLGDEVEASKLIKLRRIWDKTISEKKGFEKFADEITSFGLKVKKEATDEMRSVLAKESPKLNEVNKVYSLWSNVDEVVRSTLERTSSQSGKIRERTGAILGAITGASRGIETALITATGGKLLTKVLNSPSWKTLSAVRKNKLADALVSGKVGDIANVIKRLGILTKNEIDELTK